jgi:hypothetical protein
MQSLSCDVFVSSSRPAESSAGGCLDWSSACEIRFRSEESEEVGREGKVRRRRGRRLLIVRLLLLGRLFYGLLRCCFLRCHEHFTPPRCQNVNQCACGITESMQRVKFSLVGFFGKSERGLHSRKLRQRFSIIETERSAAFCQASPSPFRREQIDTSDAAFFVCLIVPPRLSGQSGARRDKPKRPDKRERVKTVGATFSRPRLKSLSTHPTRDLPV